MSRRVSLGSHWSGSLFSRIYFAVFIFGLAGVSSKVHEYIIRNNRFKSDYYFIGSSIGHASHFVSRSLAYTTSNDQAREMTTQLRCLSGKLDEFHNECGITISRSLISILEISAISCFVVADLNSLDSRRLNLARTTREHLEDILEALREEGVELASVTLRFFAERDGKRQTPGQQHALLHKLEYFTQEADDINNQVIAQIRSLLQPIREQTNYLRLSLEIASLLEAGTPPHTIIETHFTLSANDRRLNPCDQHAMLDRLQVYGDIPEPFIAQIRSSLRPVANRVNYVQLSNRIEDAIADGIPPQTIINDHLTLSVNDRSLTTTNKHDMLDRLDGLLTASTSTILRNILPAIKRQADVGQRKRVGKKKAKKSGLKF